MSGSVAGNVAAVIYYLLFQAAGFVLAYKALREENGWTRILAGSVLGNMLLGWIPLLSSFFLGFNRSSHILAGFLAAGAAVSVFFLCGKSGKIDLEDMGRTLKAHFPFVLAGLLIWCFFVGILWCRTFNFQNGDWYTNQSNQMDLHLHLSFITGIPAQEFLPFEYPFLAGEKLCYPFLADSVSASLYVWGASLKLSFVLPMATAIWQVFFFFYALAFRWLKQKRKALLAAFFFFLNGGLGFLYFFDWTRNREYHMSYIFTQNYMTPTNLIDKNIRWVNVLVDMLLPQRTTLFGWAALFLSLYLLYRAVFEGKKKYFIYVGLVGGMLPMLHTHSFLCLGIISACLLLAKLHENVRGDKVWRYPGRVIFPGMILLMCGIQFVSGIRENADRLMLICMAGFFLAAGYGLWLLFLNLKKGYLKDLLRTFGIYLGIILIMALPQLFYWTFDQVSQNSFLMGWFNWANQGDIYPWFYLKNWGLVYLLILLGVCYAKRRDFYMGFAGIMVLFLADLVLLSPNAYDNNKLVYIAYALFCCMAADYGIDFYEKIKGVSGMKIVAAGFLGVSCISALLSMGREAVSQSRIYTAKQLETAEYVRENIPADKVMLTNTLLYNEISTLAGRKSLCSLKAVVLTYGFSVWEIEQDMENMYLYPTENRELFDQYEIDYVLVSPEEVFEFGEIPVEEFDGLFPCIYQEGEVRIYQVS